MEYAVFSAGGKQYRAKAGDKLRVEKIRGEHKEGDSLTFDNVLMTENGSEINLGKPFLDGGKVTATLTKIGREKKVDIIHYKPKSRYLKKSGHRQPYFEIKIESIK